MLDTHELDRRPGTMRRVTLLEPAPPDLRTEVIGVPEGSELRLDLRLESVLDGILASGTVTGVAVGECARCLEPIEQPLEVQIQELFAYPGHESEDTAVVAGELIDLEPTVRDAVVTELPLAPICREDCPGLCVECGELLAADPGHRHDAIDPRWAVLESVGGAASGRALRDSTAHRDSGGDTDNTGAYVAGGYSASGDPAATTNDVRSRAGAREES